MSDTASPTGAPADPSAPADPRAGSPRGFSEQVEIACKTYIEKGLALPLSAYLFHTAKIAILFAAWVFFCSFTPGLGTWTDIGAWAFEPIAFQKACLWFLTYETLGLGCATGPLGLKWWPPVQAFLYYLRPGTTKLPLFPGAPIIGGTRRTWLDVILYAAFVASLFRALVQPEITTEVLVPIVVLLPLCALGDRVIFLTARGEHAFAFAVVFLLAGNWIAASKWVQLAIWFWAGISKLTSAFGYVIPIMTSNNPLLKAPWFRRKLYKAYPDDLSPSLLGKVMAHMGTFLEIGGPLVLLFVTQEGPLLYIGLGMIVVLHGFILSNLPMAAVFEWNLVSLYAAFFLFYFHPEVSPLAVDTLPAAVFLIVACFVVPLVGNLVPRWVSFLVAMRYYAGNWAWSAWLFRNECYEKLSMLKRSSELLLQQQRKMLPPEAAAEADSLFMAWRTLHLQGRVLGLLLPKAIGDVPFEEYTYSDGDLVNSSVIGWNFGEGHLNDERLLSAIQEQCDFEEGDVRVICVEAQPILGSSLHWRVNDAKTGLIEEGYVEIEDLKKRKPWDVGRDLNRGARARPSAPTRACPGSTSRCRR